VAMDRHLHHVSQHCCDRPLVEKIAVVCASAQQHSVYGILFVLTYAFLLRMPSEALPITAGGDGPCTLRRQGSALVLTLARRKNLPRGSTTHGALSNGVLAPVSARRDAAAGLLVQAVAQDVSSSCGRSIFGPAV
jgi:hypothetical protein